MHLLISSVAEIFASSDNSMARRVAANLAGLREYKFTAHFPTTLPLQHLHATLANPGAHPLTQDIHALAHHLPWQVLSQDIAPVDLMTGLTYCQIVGPQGLIRDNRLKMGCYFQIPELFYPSHTHNAEEVYFVLSGTALWQKDNAEFTAQSPGTLIHHLPNQPHAMHTQKEPLLAIWAWIGDIGFESYEIHQGQDIKQKI